jgi:hypothetical protein
MSDKLFFPLAFLVAAAFVFLALNPLADRPPSGPVSGGGRDAADITVAGAELHRFVAGNLGRLDISPPDGGSGAPVVHISRLAEQVYEDPRSGPHLVLAEDVEYALENREIEVIVEARATGAFSASQFQLDYLAKPGAESGWKTFDLTPQFAAYSLRFKTPPRGEAEGYDYLGIRPVAPDKRRTMEVRSVRVHAVGPKQTPAG